MMGKGESDSEKSYGSTLLNYQGLDDQYENLWSYEYHGLHPVVLGDVLPKRETCIDEPAKEPRYRIHLKIGFGAFSTVWLGFDLEQRSVDLRKPDLRADPECLTDCWPLRDMS